MKRTFLLFILAVSLVTARAQQADDAGDVVVSFGGSIIWGPPNSGSTPATASITCLGVPGATGQSTTITRPSTLPSTQTFDFAHTRLVPGVRYYISLSVDNGFVPNPQTNMLGAQTFSLEVHAPDGYAVTLDAVGAVPVATNGPDAATYFQPAQYVRSSSAQYAITLRTLNRDYSMPAGWASSLTSSKVLWELSLGTSLNGGPAGVLSFDDSAPGTALGTVFSRPNLYSDAASSEIIQLVDAGDGTSLRQLIATQVCVDITGSLTAGSSFTLACYHPSQRSANVDGTTGYYTFTGSPYASYQVQPQGSDAAGVVITCDVGQGSSRVLTTKLTRTGTAPNFTWTADGWHTGTSPQVQTIRARSGSSETVTLQDGSATVALKSTRTYTTPLLMTEEITNEAAGSTNPVSTGYTFFSDGVATSDPTYAAATSLYWAKPQATTATGGKWTNFTYNSSGHVATVTHPFNNSTAANPTAGVTDTYTYSNDAFQFPTRLASTISTQNGVTISQSSVTYTTETPFSGFSTAHPNLTVVNATSSTSADSATSYTSVKKYFQENVGMAYAPMGIGNYTTADDFFRGQIHSTQEPNGVKQSFIYQRGTWSGTAFTISGNSGLDVGEASRIISVTGSANSTDGAIYTTGDGYPVDTVYLVDKKSTQQIAIRNKYGDLVHTETRAWVSTSWNLVSSVDYTYTNAHQLSTRTSSNGGVWTADYLGERKTDETDESGVELSYTYDAADRVDTVTRGAGGSTIVALTTKFAYDAAGHATSQIVGYGGSETMASSQSFDDAGRPTSQSAPGPNGAITTGYLYGYGTAYSSVAKTLPNGGTQTEIDQVDGKPSQITVAFGGTNLAEQDFTYEFVTGTSGAQLHSTAYLGSSTSTRKQETWADWLDRMVKTSRPGFTGQGAYVQQTIYDATTGRLSRTTRTGLADILYEYDALSQPTRSGLHLGTSTNLDPNTTDRITDTDQYFQQIGTAWWLVKTTKTYPINDGHNNSTPLLVSTTRQRLTGFPGGVQAEVVNVDVDNNTIDRVVTVAPASQTTTITTTITGISNSKTETYVDGLSTSATGFDGQTYTKGYDALGRVHTQTDPRTGSTTIAYYTGTNFAHTITDAASNTVATYTYDDAGRTIAVANASGKSSRTEYDALDRVVHQWGDTTHPVEYGYDSTYGDRISMKTYRGGTGWTGTVWPGSSTGAADRTLWVYDTPSGLLENKYDAANLGSTGQPITGAQSVSFTYNNRGQMVSRTLARGATTNYGYDSSTGELVSQTYSDTTSPVSYSYTRSGQIYTVGDATGSRTFNYGVAGASPTSNPLELDSISLSGFYGGRILTRNYDSVYRSSGFKLGSAYGSSADLSQTYAFDPTTGRFASVATASASVASREFDYSYTNGLLTGLSVYGGSFAVSYDYETHRDLRTKIDSKWGGVSRTRYDYTYNPLAQRQTAEQSCDLTTGAFGDFGNATTYNYVYNDRGELTDAADYLGTDVTIVANQLSGRHFAYGFDAIGNRTSASRTGSAGAPEIYNANALNQYISRTNNYAHTAGTVANSSINIAVTGSNNAVAAPAGRQGNYWDTQVALNNGNGPATSQLTVTATWPSGGTGSADLAHSESRTAYLAQALQSFSYDADGNMTGDGIWSYGYDAENRLVSMTTTSMAAASGFPNKMLLFTYDYLGRRVQKRVLDAGNNYAEIYSRRFLYDGNNLVAEFDATGGNTCGNLLHSYTWGLDLASSLEATGGVGALIQITDGSNSYLPTYDGNGNIASLLNASTGSVVAAYEYSPSGELLRYTGTYAMTNPFRFSTKYTDDETNLVYYGARYYSPSLARFINRDPIQEAGGLNLYGFCGNDAINHTDYLGNSWLSRFLHSLTKISHQIFRALMPIRAIRSMDHRFESWIYSHEKYIQMAVAIVAAIVTYGAASEWAASELAASEINATAAAWGGIGTAAGDMAAASAAVTAGTGVVDATIAGVVGGAAAGAVSGTIMTGTVKGALEGAAAGAIMGAVQGFYGNSYPVDRIAATAVAGGASSKIQGGSFADGFKFNGAIAAVTWTALWMRNIMIDNSNADPRRYNSEGISAGFNHDNYKLGGGRFDPNYGIDDAHQISPLGGRQGGTGSITLPLLGKIEYSPGSVLDRLVETYAGPHDWLNSWWSYSARNIGNIYIGDYAPGLSVFGQHLGSFAPTFARVMNWADVGLATPLAAASFAGVNPVATSLNIK